MSSAITDPIDAYFNYSLGYVDDRKWYITKNSDEDPDLVIIDSRLQKSASKL